MKRVIFTVLVILAFSTTAQAKYSGGSGTSGDPYRIANYIDLYALADDVNDYNKCFIMTADINLAPNLPGRRNLTKALIAPDTSTSDGFQGTHFTGAFDGNDCNILNLRINGKDYLGLFGYIGSGSSVHNLGIRDINITGTGSNGGGLAGIMDTASITACCSTGMVTFIRNYAGGLIGWSYNGSVNNSHSTSVITGKGDYIGGLVGYANGSSMTNCYSTGAVKGNNYVGGIEGKTYFANITNSYATGPVTGTGNYVGGLVGYSEYGNVDNCYAVGAVKGINSVGGLAGSVYSTFYRNCYSIGLVIGNGSYVGGLVGSGSSFFIYNSFWNIELSGIALSAAGLGLTTSQMHQAFYYSVNNYGNDYPHLSWENRPGVPIVNPVVSFAGEGTTQNPWGIVSKDDFLLVCAGSFFWDKHYVLNTDIDLTGVTYTRGLIGYDKSNAFTGSFDGNNHNIRNLTIVGKDCLGLFGYSRTGSYVSDLDLEDVNVTSIGRYVGSLVGYADYAEVINCHAVGKVSGNDRVGGLIGYAYCTDVKYCHATGKVLGIDELIGGLAGHVYDGSVSNSCAASQVSGNSSVGGLAGEIGYADMTTCYSTSAVNGISYVGGLAGSLWHTDARNCCTTSEVNGVSYVGGFVGYFSDSTATNCYATGAVTGDGNYVGGLVGTALNTITIKNCYSIGAVIGDGNYIGGLIGYTNYYMIISSFWDVNTSGRMTSASGVGKTTPQMQIENTFTNAGWDFNNVWAICEGTNYPRLQWQIPVTDFVCPDGVDFADFSFFAERWLDTNCASNNDCDGTDLDLSGTVDLYDLDAFVQNWLLGL
jgi:hypothetical protein